MAHVDRDLEPYVCIAEECSEPPLFFVHRRDWLQHMLARHSKHWVESIHTVKWFCDLEHSFIPEFDDQEMFEDHLRSFHADQLSASKLEGRLRRNRRVAKRLQGVCPLCDCVPLNVAQGSREELESHIASHIKSISFISLLFVENASDQRSQDATVEDNPSLALVASDSNIDTPSSQHLIHDQELEDFHDVPPTLHLENGAYLVGDQQFSRGPTPLQGFQNWSYIPAKEIPGKHKLFIV